jgi:hypothetical protein
MILPALVLVASASQAASAPSPDIAIPDDCHWVVKTQKPKPKIKHSHKIVHSPQNKAIKRLFKKDKKEDDDYDLICDTTTPVVVPSIVEMSLPAIPMDEMAPIESPDVSVIPSIPVPIPGIPSPSECACFSDVGGGGDYYYSPPSYVYLPPSGGYPWTPPPAVTPPVPEPSTWLLFLLGLGALFTSLDVKWRT